MEQKRLRSFILTKHYLFLMTMKKWTWQKRRDKIRNARVGIKTSGFFNAGLTPCSHTTTTKNTNNSPSLGLLFVLVFFFDRFSCSCFVFCFLGFCFKYSPGGEYSNKPLSCCSVWAWRKPGIKKSWSLYPSSSISYFILHHLSCSFLLLHQKS